MSVHNVTARLALILPALLLPACTEAEKRNPVQPPLVDPPATATPMGAVLLRTVTTGVELDTDGYVVYLTAPSGNRELSVGVNDSVLIDRLPVAHAVVALREVANNCWVATSLWRALPLRPNTVTRIVYSVDCIPAANITMFNRASAHAASTLTYHGDLTERYVLSVDGRLRLQFHSSRWGFFEYLGTYSRRSAHMLDFLYGDDDRWGASATLRGDSLAVAYNLIMGASDFEDGVYMRFPVRTPNDAAGQVKR